MREREATVYLALRFLNCYRKHTRPRGSTTWLVTSSISTSSGKFFNCQCKNMCVGRDWPIIAHSATNVWYLLLRTGPPAVL